MSKDRHAYSSSLVKGTYPRPEDTRVHVVDGDPGALATVGSNPTGPTTPTKNRSRNYSNPSIDKTLYSAKASVGYVSSQETDTLTGQIRQFVIAGHGDLNRVKQMLANNPELLNAGYKWTDNDTETAVQAAAQMGNKPIAEFLLEKGAPLHICTAAMLGRRDEVEHRITLDPTQAKATGAHGIPLLAHAVFGGDLALVKFVFDSGATSGANLALQNAIMKEDVQTVKWLLDNAHPDINAKNFQGKTPIQMAVEKKNEKIAQLLTERGGSR